MNRKTRKNRTRQTNENTTCGQGTNRGEDVQANLLPVLRAVAPPLPLVAVVVVAVVVVVAFNTNNNTEPVVAAA
jgi:hypothetical protein